MQATDWEFKHRALIFGVIFGLAGLLYNIDPRNATDAAAHWLADRLHWDPDRLTRALFFGAALWVTASAFVRTWASAYLRASIVYAADVKSESLVADGPYRHVRNPLYFANVLMAIGMGGLMSRTGWAVAVVLMLVFCYRLIFREEAELLASQGANYAGYRRTVPRLWPSLLPRIGTAGQRPDWIAGLKAESWNWGFAVAVTVFAATLNVGIFFAALAVSIAAFWLASGLAQRRRA
jgi:protein-S-isoprenylcysteine O-methyltransferase Ste14